MDSPEHIRNYMKRDVEDNSDVKSDCGGDDEEWESSDKRKHKSSRPRKPNNGEEVEGLDGNGRRRSYGDRGEGRKRSGGSSRADSDEDDYDTRKDPRSKQMKKKQEESSLEKLSSWYQDGEPENRQDGGDKSGSRGHGRSDEIERRRISSKVSEHESTRSETRGMDVKMLGVPLVSLCPPGPSGPRFSNIGTPPNPGMFFNQSGPGRGGPSSISGPGFNTSGPIGRGTQSDKSSVGWVPPRTGGPPGKAPSRGEQNDYSQNFVDTGMRPQNFIRELELTNVEDYPKLRELIQKKDEIVSKSASPPLYLKCDLQEVELSSDLFGTKFDVILVDPPWEEYVHRAPGVVDHMEYWTFEEILNLKIEAIADTPSFIFLWVGDGVGLEQGRQCLKKWGFRRCEDICWVKTNKSNATPGLRHDSHTLFQHSKEHCLMGIKGTVRRSTDGHIIHANIDTDVIIAEEPPYG
ncbi:methyltransferase-like protein 1 [Carica papaya]|uniref:methyltransferase-like protein 1 n=1 Tax=Carica papaya TaxID=3649 RepID=UPI000B8C8E60|nr:methyltransferase-like protein 1 [Carica papaya]